MTGYVRGSLVDEDGAKELLRTAEQSLEVAERHDGEFPENVVLVVDDSHGVGAFGAGGRGTEAVTGAPADVLVGTLGKAFGVNGGYAVSTASVVRFLRETSPMYIYSNPITAGEAGRPSAPWRSWTRRRASVSWSGCAR